MLLDQWGFLLVVCDCLVVLLGGDLEEAGTLGDFIVVTVLVEIALSDPVKSLIALVLKHVILAVVALLHQPHIRVGCRRHQELGGPTVA
jgi:hypothetical protein